MFTIREKSILTFLMENATDFIPPRRETVLPTDILVDQFLCKDIYIKKNNPAGITTIDKIVFVIKEKTNQMSVPVETKIEFQAEFYDNITIRLVREETCSTQIV